MDSIRFTWVYEDPAKKPIIEQKTHNIFNFPEPSQVPSVTLSPPIKRSSLTKMSIAYILCDRREYCTSN